MSKLGKLVLVLILVVIVSFTFAGITFMRSEKLMAYMERNYGIETNIGFVEWLKSVDQDVVSRETQRFVLDESQDLNIAGGDQLDVSCVAAAVTVTPSPDGRSWVQLQGEISWSGETAPELEVRREGDDLVVEVEYDRKHSLNISSSDLKLDLYLPQANLVDLSINTVSGDILVKEMSLEELSAATVSGSIRSEGVDAGDFSLHSVSGDVQIQLEKIEAEMDIKTVSGDVEIEVEEETDLFLDFSSISGKGSFDYDFDEIIEMDNNTLELRRGSGIYDIRVRTTSGDFDLEVR